MGLSDITNIAASGLSAQRVRLAVTASNIANAETTRTPEGGPYRRRDPIFHSESTVGPFANRIDQAMRKVDVQRIAVDNSSPITRFDPSHPDANDEGFVEMPNVNVIREMSNLMSASRSFEANLLSIRKARAMSMAALRIGR